ncbi:MAG: hypothetical protein Q7S84_03755 [bacterium]|nr:hypothetical protein [bacterium]
MEEGNIGFFAALWRFFTLYKLRKTLGLVRAADRQFSGSVEGISDAFDITHDDMVTRYKGFRDAVSQVEAIAEQKRARFEDLNTEETDLIRKRDGAIALAEKAKTANDTAAYDKHAKAYEAFQLRIDEIETEQAQLETELKELGGTMDKYLMQLSEMQREIQRLPKQKAEEIAKFITSKQIISLNDRLQNLQTSLERGPIDVVLKANRELSAKARISEKLSGADVKLQDAQYDKEGKTAAARGKLDAILAARAAEKDAKSGTKKPEERPDLVRQ